MVSYDLMLTLRIHALFLVQASVYNPANDRGEARDVFGGAYKYGLVLIPEERSCPAVSDSVSIDVVPVTTFKDIAKHPPGRLHSGDAASIDHMLARLGEELSASHNLHASDQQDLKVAGEKLRTLEYDNARLEFRCASLFDQLMKSERQAEDVAKAHRALAACAREIEVAAENLRSRDETVARLEFRCASLLDQLMKSERRAEGLAKAHEALDAQERVIAGLEAEIARFGGRFSWRLAAFTRYCVYRLSRHGLLRPSYARLAASGLFDRKFYLEQNPDVAKAGHNPLLHFLLHGAGEGRDPSPLFDLSWYLAAYPDVAAAKINPLLHYCLHGAAESRRPRPSRMGQKAVPLNQRKAGH
jgi:hypothetical protein